MRRVGEDMPYKQSKDLPDDAVVVRHGAMKFDDMETGANTCFDVYGEACRGLRWLAWMRMPSRSSLTGITARSARQLLALCALLVTRWSSRLMATT